MLMVTAPAVPKPASRAPSSARATAGTESTATTSAAALNIVLDASAERVAERVDDRVAAVRADVLREERFDVRAHGIRAGVLGDAHDRAGAAERGERGAGVRVGEGARHVLN